MQQEASLAQTLKEDLQHGLGPLQQRKGSLWTYFSPVPFLPLSQLSGFHCLLFWYLFNLIPLSRSLSKSLPLKACIFWCVSTRTPAYPIPSHTPTIEMTEWLYWISTIQKEYGQTVYSCHTCIISGLDNEDPMWLRAWSVLVPASAITEARKGAHEKLRWDSLGVLACSHRILTFRILLK